ncbi:hypothetical protein SAMN05421676_11292 [Salinibacillus kushneri]|uniref:Lipoprotein n=1 Tax=Salinibacillus kushneri TaxID=237682 RepID=A0A1I0IJE7_9BACI|nr:hypothetical protein [Salinibacillus kushneri]SET96513.1 hypothetical protein SAMN05421676_11292 [Salinibacillus kushneri]
MKINVLILILLFITILLFGCSNGTVETERLTILGNESKVIYSQLVHEDFDGLSTQVCIENNQNDMAPFLITFEIKDKLTSIVDESSSVLEIDSRNITNLSPDEDTFCIGNTLMLKKEVSQDDLRKMVNDRDLNVSVKELNGEIISSYALQKFVIGKQDGSVVKPED